MLMSGRIVRNGSIGKPGDTGFSRATGVSPRESVNSVTLKMSEDAEKQGDSVVRLALTDETPAICKPYPRPVL